MSIKKLMMTATRDYWIKAVPPEPAGKVGHPLVHEPIKPECFECPLKDCKWHITQGTDCDYILGFTASQKGRRWTREEDIRLLELSENKVDTTDIAAEFGRTSISVEARIKILKKRRARQ